ncbi:MAG: hypothetical protein EP344_00460 [Bacteroidetes bacterium]|nr:MAG: hypothetical protein EP344_00460 [Bacteroidota bacterium]
MDIPITLFIALIATAVAIGVFSAVKARQLARQRALEALAQRLGLSFSADDRFGLLKQLKDFDLLHRERRWIGRRGRIRNVLRGRVSNTDVYLFDYTYVISTGKSTRRITQTVFFADNKDWYLPNFKLRPETWWQKALGMFDKSDINFPENPEFSGKFWLTGEFESLVRKTFHPEVQHFLVSRPPVFLEGNNFYLLAYKPKKALHPDDAEVFFEHCCQLVGHLQKEEGRLELLNLAEVGQVKKVVEKQSREK